MKILIGDVTMNARLEKLTEKYPELLECQNSIMEAFNAIKKSYEAMENCCLLEMGAVQQTVSMSSVN